MQPPILSAFAEPRVEHRTAIFLIFIVFSQACLALGYLARRRGWLEESASKPMHLWTVTLLWSPVSLLSFWSLPMRGQAGPQLLMIMLAQPVLMLTVAGAMAALARWLGCTRAQTGVLVLGAALSNHGFTLGAYLCYALLDPPAMALQYGIAFVMSMQIFMVLVFFPIANHYGPHDIGSVGRLMFDSLVTIRAMPLYLALVGAALNVLEVPFPRQVEQWHVYEILFFAGAIGSNAGIGLLLRLGDSMKAIRMHGLLALAQFVIHPLATFGLLALLPTLGLVPHDLPFHVLMIESFTPTAINLVITANLFHLDARLASVLWLWNTLAFCLVVLPGVMWFYS